MWGTQDGFALEFAAERVQEDKEAGKKCFEGFRAYHYGLLHVKEGPNREI